jgi:hypothetical protein
MATISWRARSLKAALRSALERSGVSQREVSRRLGHSNPMKVSRWLDEDESPPSAEDTASFLACINVTGDERDRILAIARAADTDWMVAGPPGINPQLASVLECERYAVRIFEFQLIWWPGLLQSSDYARTLISQGGAITQQEIDAAVLIRNARRDIVTRRNKPVRFDAVVGLPAIHGRLATAEVMTTQLQHVQDLIGLDHVTVQATNVGTDWTPGGPFMIYEFEDMPATVYLEHLQSSAFIVDPGVVDKYKDSAERLRREAMSPEVTAGLIADAIPNNSMETTS